MAKEPGRNDVGGYLAGALELAGLTQSAFADRVGHPRAFINQVIKGSRTIPEDEFKKWAESAGLSGKMQQRFLYLAAIGHLPRASREDFVDLIDRLELVESRLKALEGKRQ